MSCPVFPFFEFSDRLIAIARANSSSSLALSSAGMAVSSALGPVSASSQPHSSSSAVEIGMTCLSNESFPPLVAIGLY